MPIFTIQNKIATKLKKIDFKNEKELQNFIENNMEEIFGIRFLTTEFSTSNGGRIDSLGLDESNSPVIIEYKWGGKDDIINQSLFYLDWLLDHTGDFKILVQEKLRKNIDIDFGSPRVLLIAQTFSKFDKGGAINRIKANVELWEYTQYTNNFLELNKIASSQNNKTNNLNSDKKQTSKVNYKEYSVENHLKNKSEEIKQLFSALQERIFALEGEQKIEENPRKIYISYRLNREFIRFDIQKKVIKVQFPFKKEEFKDFKNKLSELSKVTQIRGVYCEFSFENINDLDYVMNLIEQSYLQSV